MKITVILLGFCLCCNEIPAQSPQVTQLLLDLEKLSQLKSILTDMKQGYDLLNGGYATIRNISQGSFNLHNAFLSSLLAVSPAVKKYQRIVDILHVQVSIMNEYRSAFNRFKASGLLNSSELDYLGSVYGHLFTLSLQHLDELSIVLTAGTLRMSDAERLASVDRIYTAISDQLVFLRSFNNEASILVVQRGKDLANSKILEQLNGFK